MSFNFIFLFFCLIIKTECFIKIPFIYLPNKSNKNKTPKNIISYILDLKMFGLLEIGTPKQLCHIPINFGSNTFFLPEKSSFHYDIKYNINLYDNRNSSSFQIIKEEDTYEGENFLDAYYVNDIIYFGEKKANLDFYLTTSYFYPQLGGLGLQLYPSNNENTATPNIDKTFLRKIKLSGLGNNYIWSVFYDEITNNITNIKGYLLIGDYPHLSINYPNNDKYNYSLNSIDAVVYNKKIIQTKFLMQNVQIIKNENVLLNYNENFYVNIDYNFGGIAAPEQFKIYFDENIFNNYNFCHKDNVSIISTYAFYYCDNNENVINNLKKIFPIIKMENKILNQSFIIDIKDLLYIEGDYVFILLIFQNDIDEWKLGIPFVQKYQFSINEDSKKIYFYKKIELNNDNIRRKEKNNNIYTILIIAFCIILFISGIIMGICLYYKNIRKKRKNELDENYEYVINDETNGEIIN